MFVYRSVALGLLGACCLLLAMRPPIAVVSQTPGQVFVVSSGGQIPRCPPVLERAPGPTIIDVAPGLTRTQLAQLIMLAPGERITTIDDEPVANAVDAGVVLASLDLRARRYIDLGVDGDAGPRRVLMLLR